MKQTEAAIQEVLCKKDPPQKKNLAKSTGINAIKDAIPAGPKQDFKLHTTTTHPPTIK